MTVSATNAISGIPTHEDIFLTVDASGTALEINPGDFVSYSGQHAIASHDGIAFYKASGIGIALERNPAFDWAGRQVVNSALLVCTEGQYRVSANFSGQVALGVLAFPDFTGSAVNAPSGVTGLGAVWNTALPVSVSGGTAAAPVDGVAVVIRWFNSGPAGTGQMDIRQFNRNADYF